METNNYKELRNIVFGKVHRHRYVEEMTLGGVIIPLIQLNGYKTYVYGAGKGIEELISYLWYNDIDIEAIIDNDINKKGKLVCDKIRIMHTTNLKEIRDGNNAFVIINTVFFSGLCQAQIANVLFEAGITKFYSIEGREKNNIKAYCVDWADKGRVTYYRSHFEDVCHTYGRLYDDRSREIMLEYIRAYMQADSYNLPSCDGRVKYFFGEDYDEQPNCYEELYAHDKDEIWINCGANIGDSVFLYFANGLSAKKIYAFEGDKNNYNILCSNLAHLPLMYRNQVVPVNCFIDEQTNFDEILEKDEKITFLNADIEGNELDLLNSMLKRIESDRPVMAICAYHKAEDLTEIPQFIEENCKEYELVLRKYEAGIINWKKTSELVLYAIPRERIKKGSCYVERKYMRDRNMDEKGKIDL